MSYTIEYDRQFIKSNEGFTPVWLAGENNVTERYMGRERRVRDWSIFHNFLGMSNVDMIVALTPSLTGVNEHWMKNGKWVTDDKLINWIHSGCSNAATVEEITEANWKHFVNCYITVWKKELQECKLYIHVDFDKEHETVEQWAHRVVERVKALRKENRMEAFYPASSAPGDNYVNNIKDAATYRESDFDLESWERGMVSDITCATMRSKPLPEIYIINWAMKPTTVCHRELETPVSTTEEFDAWILKAREAIKNYQEEGLDVCPVVKFNTENLRKPVKVTGDEVLVKYKTLYLSAIDDNNSARWTDKVYEAMTLPSEKAKELIVCASPVSRLGQAHTTSTAAKKKPWNVVLRIKGGMRDGNYVCSYAGKSLTVALGLSSAKVFPDCKAAEKAKASIDSRFKTGGELEVVEI